MAKIPAFHQDQLAPSAVGVAPLDTSNLQIGNSLVSSSGQLADQLQSANNSAVSQLTQGAHQAASLINYENQQQAEDLRRKQAAAAILQRQENVAYDDAQASAYKVGLAYQIGAFKNTTMDAHKDTPDKASNTFGLGLPDLVDNYLKGIPGLRPGAAVKLKAFSNDKAVTALGDLETFSKDQRQKNVVSDLSNSSGQVSTNMSSFQGSDNNLENLKTGLSGIYDLRNNADFALGTDKGNEYLTKLAKDSSTAYLKNLVDQDPYQAQRLILDGVFTHQDAYMTQDGQLHQGTQESMEKAGGFPIPQLDGDDLHTVTQRLTEKFNTIKQTNDNLTANTVTGRKQDINAIYADATKQDATPEDIRSSVTKLDELIDSMKGKDDKASMQVADFAISRRDQLKSQKTDSQRLSAEQQRLESQMRTESAQQRTDANNARTDALREQQEVMSKPENIVIRQFSADSLRRAMSTTNKVDIGTRVTEINQAFTDLNKAHDKGLLSPDPHTNDEIWIAKNAMLRGKQQEAQLALKPPSNGIIPPIFSPPEKQYYNAIATGLPKEFLATKGVLGDPSKSMDWNTSFTSRLVTSVNDYKSKHNGNLPSDSLLKQAIDVVINDMKPLAGPY